MNAKRHAALARKLIAACEGLEVAADNCRVKTSSLSRFCDPKSGHFMPADVISDLEQYCGEPIYSQALCEGRPAAPQPANLLSEVCETTEVSANLQRVVREALGDGKLSQQEDAAIEAELLRLEDQVRELRAARERGVQ